jgi:uncharacterized protein (TIGR03067 family)
MAQGPESNHAALEGWWTPRHARLGGVRVPHEALNELGILLGRGTFVFGSDSGRFTLHPAARPASIDFFATAGPNSGRFVPAIYDCAGGSLRLCLDLSGVRRPRAFDAPPGSRHFLAMYHRPPAPRDLRHSVETNLACL